MSKQPGVRLLKGSLQIALCILFVKVYWQVGRSTQPFDHQLRSGIAMKKFSSSLVFLCLVVSVLLLVSTEDVEAAAPIPKCPYRADCKYYLSRRTEVKTFSL